jgi:hypothetical protein
MHISACGFPCSRVPQLCLTIALVLASSAASSQSVTDATAAVKTTDPVAFVYVAEPNQILGYSAAADGSLTAIPGSPFSISVWGLSVNGKFLFGSRFDGVHVDAYRIHSNGALTLAATTDINQYNTGTTCPNLQASPLVLDHTGSTLYSVAYQGDVCDSTSYKSFKVNWTTGGLSYLGDSGTRPVWNFPLRFDSTNKYAYGAGCVVGLTGLHSVTESFGILERSSSGKLTYINKSAPMPPTKDSSYFFCRSLTAADRADNLTVGVYKLDAASTGLYNEGSMLATYDIQSDGSLTTKSKYNNMPWTTEVGELEDLQMSPSGKLIAVAGGQGLEVRHNNGDKAPTRYTGLLTSDLIGQTFWDNADHLYAVSLSGLLHVFTVTTTSYSEAPGSPYSIPAGGYGIPFIVQSLTPQP